MGLLPHRKTKRGFIALFVVSLAILLLFSVPSALNIGRGRRHSAKATLKPLAKQPHPILTASTSSPHSSTRTPKEDAAGESKCRSIGEESFESDASLEGTTGTLFTGKVVRQYSGPKAPITAPVSREKTRPWCRRWAVLTTIWEPSEAVRRQVKLHNWCLVIVSDTKTPVPYETGWVEGEGNGEVVVLTTKIQETMDSPFVRTIPWSHFGRKNIGYLYAIMHGASVIWDFDDDNMLKFWIPGAAPAKAPSLDAVVGMIASNEATVVDVLHPQGHNWPTYNPYPVLGAPNLPSWPRGLPLADIKKEQCSNTTVTNTKLQVISIAVLQSLAEVQPDVDAIYRITMSMPRPFAFKRTDETRPLMIPSGVLTPYNAQATLHFESAFWALLLPITVHGRVSDIWRSYLSQRLFWDCDLQVGFTARPLVIHDRTEHSDLGDLDAERDLYMKSEHLVKFLGSWKATGTTLAERIEELWIALYERQYIELKDVELVQHWLQSLFQAGYTFPALKYKSLPIPMYPQPIKRDNTDDKSCETSQSLTFWTADRHPGTRMDMPSVLGNLGHKVILAGHKGTYLKHPVVGKVRGVSVHKRISDVIMTKYKTHTTRLTESMVEENFEFYKNDVQMSSVDAFLCQFPASMCELWMPFNKTIVYATAHRYNLGRCSKEEFDRLNEHLYSLVSSDNPHHIIGALSRYDEEYMRHYTGLSIAPLYSYSGFYTAGHAYNPTRDEILVVTRESYHKALWDNRYKTDIKEFNLVSIHKLYETYELSDLVSHRAIVYCAYSVMSYKLTEFYSLSIPLFMPSMKFYQTYHEFGPDRSSLSKHYCKKPELDDQMKPHPSSLHPYSPNVEGSKDWEAEYYWLQFSDFYFWPHITYYDSFKDLEQKLQRADFHKIHGLMVEEVKRKKKSLLNTWCNVLKKVQTRRNVPNDYKKAIRELYNTTRLQVY